MFIKNILNQMILHSFLFIISCSDNSQSINDYSGNTVVKDDTCRVLFMGNSLTFYNNMPNIFKEMAEEGGHKVFVDHITHGGASLDDFLYPYTYNIFGEREWDYLILQGMTHNLAFSEYHEKAAPVVRELVDSMTAVNPEIKPLIFMRWCYQDGYYYGENYEYHMDFEKFMPKLIDGTVLFSQKMKIPTAPIGKVWYDIIREQKDTVLYNEDKVHPTYEGSFVTASVLYCMIFDERVDKNSFCGTIHPDSAAYFKQKASEVVFNEYDRWYPEK